MSDDLILCKCSCGGNVMSYPDLYECSSCKAKIWKISHGKEFKDNEAKKLFKGNTIILKGLRSSNNTLYDTKGKLEKGKLKLIFDEQTKSTTMFKCSCGGNVTKIKGGYKCHGCEQVIWERFMNKMLTFRQVKRLFKGESLQLTNLKSQRGNKFNAEIFYTGDELSLEYL
jgi:Zn finger protein HypA/HybF involved in hydrogenase expression